MDARGVTVKRWEIIAVFAVLGVVAFTMGFVVQPMLRALGVSQWVITTGNLGVSFFIGGSIGRAWVRTLRARRVKR